MRLGMSATSCSGRKPSFIPLFCQRANDTQADRDVRRGLRLQHAHRQPILHPPEILTHVLDIIFEIQPHALAQQLAK